LDVEPYIEVFTEEDLFFNITKHVIQPQFTRLTPDEKDALRNHDMFKKANCASLSVGDKICRFYMFKAGDMVKIVGRDGKVDVKVVK